MGVKGGAPPLLTPSGYYAKVHILFIAQVNGMTINELATIIADPDWIEPEASVLFNVWSNIEFAISEGLIEPIERDVYDQVVLRACAKYRQMGYKN